MASAFALLFIALFCFNPISADVLDENWWKDNAPSNLKNISADVVFIVDGSGGLDEMASVVIYEYVKTFLKPFKYGHDDVQAAMVVYSYEEDPEDPDKTPRNIHFNEAKTFDEFLKLVDNRMVPQGSGDKANIDEAYKVTLEEILTEKNGARRNANKLVLHFPTQKSTGYDPAVRAALIRQQAEMFVISYDSRWGLNDSQLLALAGDWDHIYQYNDVNNEEALAKPLPLATWRAISDAAIQTFFTTFVDDSIEYNEKFNQAGSMERAIAVQGYHELLSSVYRHSGLHTSVIDIISFEKTDKNKTRILGKTTFRGYTEKLTEDMIQDAVEYLAQKQSWNDFKASRHTS